MTTVTSASDNPFVGLRPFGTADAPLYFGREQSIMEMLDILHHSRMLPVVGSSGCGKSSLVLAGLIPRLRAGFLVADRSAWQIATMRPGDAPLARLLDALHGVLPQTGTPEDRAALMTAAFAGHMAPIVGMTDRLPATDSLLLVVDQFEELFAFRGPDPGPSASAEARAASTARRAEATAFVDVLLALAAPPQRPVFVVLTMRSDFLGECDVFYGLPEAMNRGRFLVPRMSREELREAVEGPVRRRGRAVSARLLDHVRNQLGDRMDRLPVLQHALQRTWEAWEQDGQPRELDLSHYEAGGTIDRALDADAEAALAEVVLPGTASLELCERVFRALCDVDAHGRVVRRPRRLSELCAIVRAEPAEVQRALEPFVAPPRCFVQAGPGDDPRIDVSHESLLRKWGRLRQWSDDESKSRALFQKLVASAELERSGTGSLWRPPELGVAQAWLRKEQPSAAWAGDASRFAMVMSFVRRSGRANLRASVIRGVSIAASLLAAWALNDLNKDNAAKREALGEATAENRANVAGLRRAEKLIDSASGANVMVLGAESAELRRYRAVISARSRNVDALTARRASILAATRAARESAAVLDAHNLARGTVLRLLDSAQVVIESTSSALVGRTLSIYSQHSLLTSVPSRIQKPASLLDSLAMHLADSLRLVNAEITAEWERRDRCSPLPRFETSRGDIPTVLRGAQRAPRRLDTDDPITETARMSEPAPGGKSVASPFLDRAARLEQLARTLLEIRRQRMQLKDDLVSLRAEATTLAQQEQVLREDMARIQDSLSVALSARNGSLATYALLMGREQGARTALGRETGTLALRQNLLGTGITKLSGVTTQVGNSTSALEKAYQKYDSTAVTLTRRVSTLAELLEESTPCLRRERRRR